MRRVIGTRQVGHTGTLDPFATGLLIVVVGRATRLTRFLAPLVKRYRAVARLGVRTDTDDSTGRELARTSPEHWPDATAVRQAMTALGGRRDQRPPAYSAKRIAGRRSYDLARTGRTEPLAPVAVEVHRFELLRWAPPEVEFMAEVGTGTYIRALARDLGDALGVGAHLTALRREAIGSFEVASATPLDQVTATTALLPPAELLAHLAAVPLSAGEAEEVRHGRLVPRDATAGWGRLMYDDRLWAVGEAVPGGWHPSVVLAGA